MEFVPNEDEGRARNIDSDMKNKWRKEWLEEEDDLNRPFRLWLRKTTQPGAAWCHLCSQKLVYKSNGKKSILVHAADEDHVDRLNALEHTSTLPSAEPVLAPVSKIDDLVDAKIRVCAFLAEHCLPLDLSPHLIEFCQKLAEKPETLKQLAMCRATATYTMTHGVAKALTDDLFCKLQAHHFSLSIDEATNNANTKVVNALVRYFEEERGEVVTQLLGSFHENIANAQNIFAGLQSLLDRNEPPAENNPAIVPDPSKCVPVDNIVSCLMDNCNVMRGKKNGVEALLRHENQHLLDIHGDTVHIVSNVAKEFCKPFENYLEEFAADVYYDFKVSSKASDLFMEVCSLLHLEQPLLPKRPVGSRFLQMLDVCERLDVLFDPLIVFQFAFLQPAELHKHRELLQDIYQRRGVSEAEKARVIEIWKQSKGCQSQSERKDRILLRLFDTGVKTKFMIHVYRGILIKFQKFVKLYQSQKPVLHTLHADMYTLTREFLGLFVKADAMPTEVSVTALKKVDCSKAENQVSDASLCVGTLAYAEYQRLLTDKKESHWFCHFQKKLREGFRSACYALQTKLPLENRNLSNLAALDPEMHGCESTAQGLRQLAANLPNVIGEEDAGTLYEEARDYNSNAGLKTFLNRYKKTGRIDLDWWDPIFKLKRYPMLGKLVRALLSIFSGPLIESTFNIMDDIVESDRSSLTTENYQAIAVIKSDLKAKGKTSSTMEISSKMRRTCTSAYSTYQDFLHSKKKRLKLLQQRRIEDALQKLTAKQSTQKQGAEKKQGAQNQGAEKKQGAQNQGAEKKQGAQKQSAERQGAQKQGAETRGAHKEPGEQKQDAQKHGDEGLKGFNAGISSRLKGYTIPKLSKPSSNDSSDSKTNPTRQAQEKRKCEFSQPPSTRPKKKQTNLFSFLSKTPEKLTTLKPTYTVYRSIDEKLAKEGRKLHYMSMDGNCFYRAISLALDGTDDKHLHWRDVICAELEADPSQFRQFVDGPLEDHIKRVRRPTEWAETVDMYAAAQLLQRDLYILSPKPEKEDDGTQYRWLKVPAPATGGAPRDEVHSGHRCDYLTLCHTHGNHFDLVKPVTGCNCDVLPPSLAAAPQMTPPIMV